MKWYSMIGGSALAISEVAKMLAICLGISVERLKTNTTGKRGTGKRSREQKFARLHPFICHITYHVTACLSSQDGSREQHPTTGPILRKIYTSLPPRAGREVGGAKTSWEGELRFSLVTEVLARWRWRGLQSARREKDSKEVATTFRVNQLYP